MYIKFRLFTNVEGVVQVHITWTESFSMEDIEQQLSGRHVLNMKAHMMERELRFARLETKRLI